MTREQFVKEIMVLAEVFETELTEARLEIYWQILKHLSLAEFRQSIQRILAIKTFHKFPLPAHFLGGQDGDTQALFAIESVNKAIRDHGSYASIIFQDPILGEIVENFDGGWQGLCARSAEELVWDLKHLTKLYQAKWASGSYGSEPIKLIGSCEFMGAEVNPVMIGGEPVKQIARDEREIKKLRGEG